MNPAGGQFSEADLSHLPLIQGGGEVHGHGAKKSQERDDAGNQDPANCATATAVTAAGDRKTVEQYNVV